MRKILILAANPKNTNKLRLDEEVREIQEGLQRSRNRDQFEVISRWAVRPNDLRRALLDHEPQIVHFSGHGAGAEGLALEDNSGQIKLVSSDALVRLFGLFEKKVECVLLNACYSDIQADAIHQHVDCVIGMSEAIGDRAAINFAVGFYDGLGANRSYADAFQFGLTAIDLEGIPETATPKLRQSSPNSSPQQPIRKATQPSPVSISTDVNPEPESPSIEQMVQYNSNDVQAHQTIVQSGAKAYIGNNQIHNYSESIDSKDSKFLLISANSMVERLALEVTNLTSSQLQEIRDLEHKGLIRSAQRQVQKLRISENWEIYSETLQIEILKILAGYTIILDDDTAEASNLLQEALQIDPNADLTFIQMLLCTRTRGIRAFLEEFNNFNNINHINLKLALLLEINQAEQAIATIQTIPEDIQLNADTYRLHALALLIEGNVLKAQHKINEAISAGPEWDTVREAEALINYHQCLSPTAIQKGRFPIPEPVDIDFIKHDDDSLACLRKAEAAFSRLALESERTDDLQRYWKIWQLACLANDPTRQDEAVEFCKDQLTENPGNAQVILWAIARNYPIDIANSQKALKEFLQVVTNDREAIESIPVLLWLYLKDDKSQEALDLLNQTREKFVQQNDLNYRNQWYLLHVQTFAANGRLEEAIQEIESLSDPQARRFLKTLVLREIATKSGDWQAVVEHLENCFEETQDSKFLYECCSLKAYLKDWLYVAERAELLLEKISTAGVLNLAVDCSYRANRPTQCVKLLSENQKLFPKAVLPENLRHLKAWCLAQAGSIKESAAEAEALANEHPTANNLATLLAIQFRLGDIRRMEITARQLLNSDDDVPTINLLQAARFIQSENFRLARQLWQKATETPIDKELLGEVIDLGFQLSFDENDLHFRQFLLKAQLLARENKGPFKVVLLREFISLQHSQREQANELSIKYDRGELPIHLIVGINGLPLINVYKNLLRQNSTDLNLHNRPSIFTRHGGRPIQVHPLSEEFRLACERWRLHLDVSAFLLADYLGIIDLLEEHFKPLKISAVFQPALALQLQKLQSHQPSQIKLYQQTIELLNRNALKESPRQADISIASNLNLVEQKGQQWVTLLEKTKAEEGFLVEFLPLQVCSKEGELRPLTLSPEDQSQVINCRSLLEALKQCNAITESKYQSALTSLKSNGHTESSTFLPQINAPIYLMGCIALVLAKARILVEICEYFQVTVDFTYLDEARLAISANEQRTKLVDEIADLIQRVRDGLETHTYETVELSDSKSSQELKHKAENNLDLLTAFDLFAFEPQSNDNLDVIWVDDRFLNQFLHRDGIQIITIVEVLDALLAVDALSQDEYYDKLLQLRKANVRYIPITSNEIVYWLHPALVIDGYVRENEALKVLRQYVASCLLDTHRLQLPTISDSSPNRLSEVNFLLNCLHATEDALVAGWLDDSVSNENAVACANWVLINLYTGIFGACHLTLANDSGKDGIDLMGLDISNLYMRGIELSQERDNNSLKESPRENYFTWLSLKLGERRFKADPDVVLVTAQMIYFSIAQQRKIQSENDFQDKLFSHICQQFYYDLPPSLRTRIKSDLSLMNWLNIQTMPSVQINSISFPAADFWKAAEIALSGKEATVTGLEPKIELKIRLIKKDSIGDTLEIKSHDGSIVQEVNDPLFLLLLDAPSRREEFLKSCRFWFDCNSENLDNIIAEIASINEPHKRIELAESWRKQSVAFFYEKIKLELSQVGSLSISELMPPLAEGLLRHFRIDTDFTSGKDFHQYLNQAAQSLIAEEGLEEALERLACLPVKLPFVVYEEIGKLASEDRQALFKKLASSWASPICKLHLLDLVLEFSQDEESELTEQLLGEIYSDTAIPHFNLLCVLLQLTDNAFSFHPCIQEWPTPIRLAMNWAHASKLQNILDTPNLHLHEFIEHLWEYLQNQVNHSKLNLKMEFWNDVLNPYRFDRIVIAVHGLASLVQNKPSEVLKQSRVIECLQRFAVTTIEDHSIPNPQLFRDPILAQDNLGSILGGDRGHLLAPIIGSELAQHFQSISLKQVIEKAISNLEHDPTDLSQWKLLDAIVGDLPVYEDVRASLERVLADSCIATWIKLNPDLGLLVLEIGSKQVRNIVDEEVQAHIENQFVSLIKLLAEEEQDEIDENLIDQVFGTIFRLSIKPENPRDTCQSIADLIISAVSLWPKFADTYIYTALFKLIQELPIEQLNRLWKVFLHLRAIRT